jgi:phosphate:Na+ symporter
MGHSDSSFRTVVIVGLVSGFGLIFIGIGLMPQGMSGLEGFVTPESFPSDHLAGRLLLVAIGIAITLVTQSSSAGIATALAAAHADTISF